MPDIPQENEVLALRQELADTRKKLQDYADTIVSLHGELRILRDTICDTCKRNVVLANLKSPQDDKTKAVGSSSFGNHPHSQVSLEHNSPPPKKHHAPPNRSGSPVSKILNYFMRNSSQTSPSKLSLTPSPPRVVAVHANKPASILSQLSSSKAMLSKIEPSVSHWSAERDATADAVLEVTFVRAFINEYPVSSVQFSPDGKYLAAALGNIDGVVNGATVIYNVETGEQTCVLAENSSKYFLEEKPGISCLSFSPDGRYLAVGDNRSHIMVWDIANKRIRTRFSGHSHSASCVHFSPNGRFVVSASPYDDTVRLWNLRDGSAKIFPDARNIWSATFSPDGKYIAAGNTFGTLMIWDVRTVRLVKRWTREGQISCVAFTPDGRGLLSGHDNGTVKNWNIGSLGTVPSDGEAVPITLEYKGLKGWIYGIAVSPDGRWVVSTSWDKKTVIWDARSATRQCKLIGHGEDLVTSLDFSPSGEYLALGCQDRRVSLWKYVSP